MCEAAVKCALLSQHVSLQDKAVEELNNIVSTEINILSWKKQVRGTFLKFSQLFL